MVGGRSHHVLPHLLHAVVAGEPGAGPGQGLPQLLGPPEGLVDGGGGGGALHQVLQHQRLLGCWVG